MSQRALLHNEDKLIAGCKKGDRAAQRDMYTLYADTMMGVCIRYVKERAEAEDILVNGFIKVFEKIGQFESAGSFEGWIRRIMVNECLMFLRKKNRLIYTEDVGVFEGMEDWQTAADPMEAAELLAMVAALPDGYRAVFNLYAVEGYSHKEIAEALGISEGTSKSQLNKARKHLQNQLKQYEAMSEKRRQL